jgi:quercetin dioxygenase-like cupin family protein
MTTSEQKVATWPWPPELDAMEAAPENHTLLFENDAVRVLDAHVEPGDTVPVHTHRWPSVLYVLSPSEFVRRDPQGNVLLDTRGMAHPAVGSVSWDPPLTPHSLENVGSATMRSIMVELKGVGA